MHVRMLAGASCAGCHACIKTARPCQGAQCARCARRRCAAPSGEPARPPALLPSHSSLLLTVCSSAPLQASIEIDSLYEGDRDNRLLHPASPRKRHRSSRRISLPCRPPSRSTPCTRASTFTPPSPAHASRSSTWTCSASAWSRWCVVVAASRRRHGVLAAARGGCGWRLGRVGVGVCIVDINLFIH